MRVLIPFNNNWLFRAEDVSSDVPDEGFEVITLPHTTQVLPHHNFDPSEYGYVSTYRKHFRLPKARDGRRVYIDFDGAMIAATVSINGHEFPEHRGGYTPFSFDLTDYLDDDGENLLVVKLDSSERPDIPPFGYVVDYLAFSGIYRDVRLRYVEPVHIKDVFVRTYDVLTNKPKAVIEVTIQNQSKESQAVTLHIGINDGKIYDGGSVKEIGGQDINFTVPAQSQKVVTAHFDDLPKVELWSPDNPARHGLHTELRGENFSDDNGAFPFGFREAYFSKEDGKFYLNGQPLKLRGLNRHQTFPFIGAAASARLQRKDADILKYELGCNIVRTSHYPQSTAFLDRCDEIGLLVFEEIPGWQHIGDADWQAISQRDVRTMIERDRNHPSIIMWGVRINESPDDSAFYEETNTIAHEADPTRPTGGVRNFQQSQFMEDVFTYNDFSDTILPLVHIPQLVTEFNGHMFPTKIWDQEERLVEHALRHARIQNTSYGMEKLAGAIGWCAFDYNTHAEFGSGDRICYHGVMDMYRLPKFAAYFYASQQDPAQRVVLHAATLWTMGDNNTGGVEPLVIFSNCEEVDVWYGEKHHGRFKPDHEHFAHLPHPPFVIRGLNGVVLWKDRSYGDLRIVGYIGGKAAAEQWIEAGAIPSQLTLSADDTELRADGQDMTRVVFKVTDKYGNRLPYTQQVVTFEVEGEADLFGENPFALMGGQAAFYLRARHTPGTVTIRVKTPRLPEASIQVTLK